MSTAIGNFGVTLSWQSATVEALASVAKESDRLGFGSFWIPEAWSLEAFSATSYILGKTERIRIGTGIVNVYSRSAALIGMACATVDQIAPGRFMLGLGSSARAVVEDFHGVKFEKPLIRTKEYVEVIRKVSRGEQVDHNGEVLKLSRFRLFTKPVESDVEIYLGAIGERNLRLAGQISDGAILAQYPISKLGYASTLVNEHPEDSGSKVKQIFAYYPTAIASSQEEIRKARGLVVRNIGFYIASMGRYYSSNLSKLGFSDDVEQVREAYSKEGMNGAAAAVSDRLTEELSLIGERNAILEKIAKLPEGVHPVFAFSGRTSDEIANAIKYLKLIAS